MPNELRTEVEQIKQREEVQRALKQASIVKPEAAPRAETKDKLLLDGRDNERWRRSRYSG